MLGRGLSKGVPPHGKPDTAVAARVQSRKSMGAFRSHRHHHAEHRFFVIQPEARDNSARNPCAHSLPSYVLPPETAFNTFRHASKWPCSVLPMLLALLGLSIGYLTGGVCALVHAADIAPSYC
eukprot:264698-Prymnesium_polylepis.1